MKLSLLLSFSGLLCAQFICGQDQNEAPDFRKLRYDFAAKEGYKPYAIQLIEQTKIAEAMKHWVNNEEAQAFDIFDEILEIYPWSIETHRRMADGFEIFLEAELTEEQRQLFTGLEAKHRKIYKGLIQSIMKDCDGKTPETAFKVITLPEQAWVLSELKLQPSSRGSNVEKGLDIYEFEDEDGETFKIYFDISILVATLNDELAAEEKEPDQKKKASKPIRNKD